MFGKDKVIDKGFSHEIVLNIYPKGKKVEVVFESKFEDTLIDDACNNALEVLKNKYGIIFVLPDKYKNEK